MKAKGKPKLLRSINSVLEFGKHKGKTISQVMVEDVNWLHWALEEIPDFKLNRNALLILPPKKEIEWFDTEDDAMFRDAFLSDMGDR